MLFPVILSGIFLSFRFGFFQLRPKTILKFTKESLIDKNLRRTTFTTLAATMGTGNITGVAAALSVGGAGAVFWLWVSSFFGMGLAFAENFMIYRLNTLMMSIK